jgi:hypothetical protein
MSNLKARACGTMHLSCADAGDVRLHHSANAHWFRSEGHDARLVIDLAEVDRFA